METKALPEGMKTVVKEDGGPWAGHTAIVIDPKPVPDSDLENRRKILVELPDVFDRDDQPVQTYILPRMLALASADVPLQAAPKHTAQQHDDAPTSYVLSSEPITDPMDPALDRFRPNAEVVSQYVHRMVPGGFSDIEYAMALREQRDNRGFSRNIALVGETQSGKTMFVQVLAVLAAERDGLPKPYPIFTVSGSSGVTNYDLYGQTTAVIIDGKEVLVWMEGLIPIGVRTGSFIYLDEWNSVPPAAAVTLHPILDSRRFFVNTQRAVPDGHGGFQPEVVNANPKMWAIATINPSYKGSNTLNEATSNRFQWLPWDYDEDTEEALIPSKTVRIIGDHLREARAGRTITIPVGTSALQRFNADCAMFGVENAMWSFKGLFPSNEWDVIDTIVEDGGMLDLLKSEYPEPTFKPGDAPPAAPDLAATWDPDALATQRLRP